jgi:hypothetical protein
MRGKAIRIFMVLFLTTLILSMAGCSRFSQPSDAEVIKAIEDSGILKGKTFTITSPLVVLERSAQTKDGSWPVKVKMTMIIQMPDGTLSNPRENTPTFRIFKSTDSAGHAVWKAALGY